MYAEEIMTQYKQKFGGVAQLGEHLPCKQGVRSSILLISTKNRTFWIFSQPCVCEYVAVSKKIQTVSILKKSHIKRCDGYDKIYS